MNIERMTALAERIRGMDHVDHERTNVDGFNMATMLQWSHDDCGSCHTVSCAAGTAVLMYAAETAWMGGSVTQAAAILDLTLDQAEALFTPVGAGPWHEITPAATADVIDGMVAARKARKRVTVALICELWADAVEDNPFFDQTGHPFTGQGHATIHGPDAYAKWPNLEIRSPCRRD